VGLSPEPTEPLLATNLDARRPWRFRCHQSVVDARMIPLAVRVGTRLPERSSTSSLTKEPDTVQALLRDRSDEPFGVSLAVTRHGDLSSEV
jgi:hypothetical protein